MNKVEIGGRSVVIAPFKLRELRQAAPHIDDIMSMRTATRDDADALTQMTSGMHSILLVLAVGIRRAHLDGLGGDPVDFDRAAPLAEQLSTIADDIEGSIEPADMTILQPVFNEILRESGMARAGADPRPALQTEAAPLQSESMPSSQSSSQQASAEGTGTA